VYVCVRERACVSLTGAYTQVQGGEDS